MFKAIAEYLFKLSRLYIAAGTFILLNGCGEQSAAPTPAQPKEIRSQWTTVNGSTVVGVDDQTDAELSEAMKQARASAETARARWTAAPEAERERWAIKWIAPLTDGAVEHVWVKPLNWSPFRVEGVLLSKPTAELQCGKAQGEIVSFPIDELSDWIYYTDASAPLSQGQFEGGFTVKALESRFGRP